MNDDLNTSIALSVIFELVRVAKGLLEKGDASAETLIAVEDMFNKLGGQVLGIVKEEYAEAGAGDEAMIDVLVAGLIEQRAGARKRKDFASADKIRDELGAVGIVLEDKPGGTTWRRK
jgi:cysteinyl-tRNA synthetase